MRKEQKLKGGFGDLEAFCDLSQLKMSDGLAVDVDVDDCSTLRLYVGWYLQIGWLLCRTIQI